MKSTHLLEGGQQHVVPILNVLHFKGLSIGFSFFRVTLQFGV